MSEKKKFKKVSKIILIAAVTLVALITVGSGLFLYHVTSNQDHCDDYADQRFGAQDENLIEHDSAYSQCMKDKGLSDYANLYHR